MYSNRCHYSTRVSIAGSTAVETKPNLPGTGRRAKKTKQTRTHLFHGVLWFHGIIPPQQHAGANATRLHGVTEHKVPHVWPRKRCLINEEGGRGLTWGYTLRHLGEKGGWCVCVYVCVWGEGGLQSSLLFTSVLLIFTLIYCGKNAKQI